MSDPSGWCLAPWCACPLAILLSQGQSQEGQELVHSHMDLGGEVFGEQHTQDHKDAMGQELEVDRVNPEHEGVQLAKSQKTPDNIINFAHGLIDAAHNGDTVLPDWGRPGAQVLPVGKVRLGLGVHHQHSGKSLSANLLGPAGHLREEVLHSSFLLG